VATRWWKQSEDMITRFDRIHERNRQTDRHRMTAQAPLMHARSKKLTDQRLEEIITKEKKRTNAHKKCFLCCRMACIAKFDDAVSTVSNVSISHDTDATLRLLYLACSTRLFSEVIL